MRGDNVGAPRWPVLSEEMTPTKQDLELLTLMVHGEHCPHQVPPTYSCQCGAVIIRNLARMLAKRTP